MSALGDKRALADNAELARADADGAANIVQRPSCFTFAFDQSALSSLPE